MWCHFLCVCVCLCREGVAERGGRWSGGLGGGRWYNIIKIGWPSQGSACYCLFNLKKMACKNSPADAFFSFCSFCEHHKDSKNKLLLPGADADRRPGIQRSASLSIPTISFLCRHIPLACTSAVNLSTQSILSFSNAPKLQVKVQPLLFPRLHPGFFLDLCNSI